MTIATYAQLQAAAQDFGNRLDTSVSARVADFIRLAEDRIWRTNENGVIRSQWGIVNTPLVIPAGQNWVALPSDWLQFKRITLPTVPALDGTGSNVVEYMSPDMLEDLPPAGNANAYSVEGGRLLYGLPQAAGGLAQTLTCRYYAHPGNLGSGAAATTTWLLTMTPSIYLYATLLEMAIYVKKADKIAEYGSLLDKAVAGFMSTERAANQPAGRARYRRA
jgi:hypothetical protein